MSTVTLPNKSLIRFNFRSDAWLSAFAIVFSLLFGLAAALMTGKGLETIISAFYDGAFGSEYAIGASLNRSAVLAMVGL